MNLIRERISVVETLAIRIESHSVWSAITSLNLHPTIARAFRPSGHNETVGPVEYRSSTTVVRVHAKADFRRSRTHSRALSRTAIQRRYLELCSRYLSYSGLRCSTGASLILFLAADDSGAVTNQSYIIDGGCVGIRLPDFWQIFGKMAFEGRFRRKQKSENNREFTGDWIGGPGWT